MRHLAFMLRYRASRYLSAFAFAVVALIGCATLPARAQTGCLPTTGVFTAVQEQQFVNAALAGVFRSNFGPMQPVTDCSDATVEGQPWLDNSQSPHPYGLFDGSQFPWFGFLDDVNHLWLPVMGGGIATLTAGNVTDLCFNVPQNYITISGTTAIASFGTSCAIGQIKKLNFTSTLLLTFNAANIVTLTGQSVTTANGDQAEAIYLGAGVWQITNYVTAGGAVPVGTVLMSAGPTAPPGYLLCFGQAVSRTTFPALFAFIGTTYGTGDGSTTFNLPDYRGYALAGLDGIGGVPAAGRITVAGGNFDGTVLGNSGGNQNVSIARGNLPNYNLPISFAAHVPAMNVVNSASGLNNFFFFNAQGATSGPVLGLNGGAVVLSTPQTNIAFDQASVQLGGSGTALASLPPTKTVNYMIKF